jgi:Protein of unknown function (DUF2384)
MTDTLESKLKEYADLNLFIHKLKYVIEEKKIMPWLCKPNKAFNDRTPMEMIMAGETEQLNKMIYEAGEVVFQ